LSELSQNGKTVRWVSIEVYPKVVVSRLDLTVAVDADVEKYYTIVALSYWWLAAGDGWAVYARRQMLLEVVVGTSHRFACYQRKGVGTSHEAQLMQCDQLYQGPSQTSWTEDEP